MPMPLYLQVNYEYFMWSPFILEISELDYYFPCQLLTGDSIRNIFLSNDLPKYDIFMDETCFSFTTVRIWRACLLNLTLILLCTEVFEQPVTEG